MLKQLMTAVIIASVAACSGGGSGSGSGGGGIITPPTNAPPTQYKVRLTFAGGASLRTPQIVLRNGHRLAIAHPLDSSNSSIVQLPIEMAAAPNIVGGVQSADAENKGVATVEVQPQPSASPNVALSSADLSLVVQPQPSAAAGAQFTVSDNYPTPQAGAVIATVTGSANVTATIPTYIVNRENVYCGSSPVLGSDSKVHPEDQIGAIQFVNGVTQTVTTPGPADMYWDGPDCTSVGFTNSLESEATLHFPYGAVFESSVTSPFASLAATSWSNTFTSIGVSELTTAVIGATANPDDEILVKTSTGSIVKFAITRAGGSNPEGIAFDYEVSGLSVDGF